MPDPRCAGPGPAPGPDPRFAETSGRYASAFCLIASNSACVMAPSTFCVSFVGIASRGPTAGGNAIEFDQPVEAFRRRIHHTTPAAATATAKIPKAIQPQGVSLLSASAFFEATAAPAAAAAPGLSPLVVVCTVVVPSGAGAAAVVVAVVVDTTVAV